MQLQQSTSLVARLEPPSHTTSMVVSPNALKIISVDLCQRLHVVLMRNLPGRH